MSKGIVGIFDAAARASNQGRDITSNTYRLRLTSGQVVTVEHRTHPAIPPGMEFVRIVNNGCITHRKHAEALGLPYEEINP